MRDRPRAVPLVAELEALATRYHENPARLDAVRDGLTRAAREEPDPETWIALARACFIWGDVRATTEEQKLDAYAEGREAARRASSWRRGLRLPTSSSGSTRGDEGAPEARALLNALGA